ALGAAQAEAAQARLLQHAVERLGLRHAIHWYYTPMALGLTGGLTPLATIYDCMDELSLFRNAPTRLVDYEAELLKLADVVFTGGHHLYEFKRDRHSNIHPMPSSIDKKHFMQARELSDSADPSDQVSIPHPRIGFYGVIDDRLDLELLRGMAEAKPDWQLILIGPVVNKISQESLPKAPNIHYLGQKHYQELPRYLSGWDVAMLPFAKVEATRFISPTKTPEYLAAGKPVVSTSIRDVVRPYGEEQLVLIGDTVDEFIHAIETALRIDHHNSSWKNRVDEFLSDKSWDQTWSKMAELIQKCVSKPSSLRQAG
ncbi:MAG: glycosyltransferase, partial [Bdellovibrionia bacterium]